MIPRLRSSGSGRKPKVDWPEVDGRHRQDLFSPRKAFRKIVVVVDAHLPLPHTGQLPASAGELLTVLMEHPLVLAFRYADEGPPPGTPTRPEHPKLHDGWAVVSDHRSGRGWGVVYSSEPGSWTSSGISGNATDVAEGDNSSTAYLDLDPSERAARRRSDALAVQVAGQALTADLYVSDRPYALDAAWLHRDVAVCTVLEAVALIGFYLRCQDEYPVGTHYSYDRGLFFWVGARELLPSAWRWFNACVQHSSAADDDSLMLLAGSLIQRVERALEGRDRVHLALNVPQHNGTQAEALSQLDVVLFNLMGSVDVAARVAHITLGLPRSSLFNAAWQKRRPNGWLSQVRAVEPDLAAVVEADTQADHALTILRLLRNSVHGAALQGIAAHRAGAPVESLVALPPDDEAKILAAADALGGRAVWGMTELLPNRFHIDPGVFIEELFDHVLVVLNLLLDETPVERLPGVSLSATDRLPPPLSPRGHPLDPFDPRALKSIRWQLGFS